MCIRDRANADAEENWESTVTGWMQKGCKKVNEWKNKMCCALVVRIEVTVYFVVTEKKYTLFSHTKWAHTAACSSKAVFSHSHFSQKKKKGISIQTDRARFIDSLFIFSFISFVHFLVLYSWSSGEHLAQILLLFHKRFIWYVVFSLLSNIWLPPNSFSFHHPIKNFVVSFECSILLELCAPLWFSKEMLKKPSLLNGIHSDWVRQNGIHSKWFRLIFMFVHIFYCTCVCLSVCVCACANKLFICLNRIVFGLC